MEITYEQLFDTLRREKSKDDLQKLEKDFYDRVRIFLSIKQDTIQAEGASHGIHSLAAQRAQIEYQNTKKIIKELYERRERKIVTLAMHRTRTEAAMMDADVLLPEEKVFLEALVHLLVQQREQAFSAIESRAAMVVTPTTYDQDIVHKPSPEQAYEQPYRVEVTAGDTYSSTPENGVKVRFLAPVPKFVGKDLRVFGPFEEGQTTTLPEEIAAILVKKGRAQEIDTIPAD